MISQAGHLIINAKNLGNYFFVGAVYEFTYNHKNDDFTQSQLGMILELPSVYSIMNKKKIPIMVAPPGLKVVEFDENKTRSQYEDEGWVKKHIGEVPTTKYSISSGMRGMRH